MLLSILILSVYERCEMAARLCRKVSAQAPDDVEVLCLGDNRRRSIGAKRNALLATSAGRFVTFIDDDDDVADDYVPEVRHALLSHPEVDVVVFNQQCQIEDFNTFLVRFGIEYTENQRVTIRGGHYEDITRPPWHQNIWKGTLARRVAFPDVSFMEDWAWASQLNAVAKTQHRIDKTLHYYRLRADQTTATPSSALERCLPRERIFL